MTVGLWYRNIRTLGPIQEGRRPSRTQAFRAAIAAPRSVRMKERSLSSNRESNCAKWRGCNRFGRLTVHALTTQCSSVCPCSKTTRPARKTHSFPARPSSNSTFASERILSRALSPFLEEGKQRRKGDRNRWRYRLAAQHSIEPSKRGPIKDSCGTSFSEEDCISQNGKHEVDHTLRRPLPKRSPGVAQKSAL